MATEIAALIADWLFRGDASGGIGPFFAPLLVDQEVDGTIQGFGRDASDLFPTEGCLTVVGNAIVNASDIIFADMTGADIHYIGVGPYGSGGFDPTVVFELDTPASPEPAGTLIVPADTLLLSLSAGAGVDISEYATEEVLKFIITESSLVEDFPDGFFRHLGLIDNTDTEFTGGGYGRIQVRTSSEAGFRAHTSGLTEMTGSTTLKFTENNQEGLAADTLAAVRFYDDDNNPLVTIEVPVDVTVNQGDKLWFEETEDAITIESTIT